MVQTPYKNLTVEERDDVAIVTFNRPHKANALDRNHLEEIEQVALSFRDDPQTRVVIFTGKGKHFSSGADLTPTPNATDRQASLVLRRRRSRIGERAIRAVYEIDQVTIAAWNGAAMGGGACLATALDFRIGSSDCFMQYPEVEIGVNLMWKSLPLLVHLAGPARAKRLVAGGERIHADELRSWGILDCVVERDDLLDTALDWALRYAKMPPIPQQMIKQSINAIASAQDASIMHMDVDQNLLSASTQDAKTAVRGYREGTTPEFRGD